ncbi:RHS repeat-associated core domain-containing protein [Pseudomonas sp. URMO17WK12:I11]|uniref:RHS repeat-associated core domain-containing protein n=1 Tax=Pseudomonas sp. URMO17WK12:I11 TaxID=1283291 RepID=UPI0011A629FA
MEHVRLLALDGQRSVIHDSAYVPRAYTAYGRSADQDGPMSAFCGEPKDPLTGCYHLGNGYRQFNPGIMRFQSADRLSPFGKGGMNAYMYCAGDPVNRRDPSGGFPLRRTFTSTLPTTTPPPPVPAIVSAVAGHALNGGVVALNAAGAVMSLVLPVPTSRWGVGANALAVLGGAISTGAAITSYTRFAPQAFVAGALGTDLVALSLVTKAVLVVKPMGLQAWQNVKANTGAMVTAWFPRRREPISLELTEVELMQDSGINPARRPPSNSPSNSLSDERKDIRSS